MNSRIVVVAIIEKNGKVLLGQKPKDVGPYPNTWHFPGGGARLGEETIMEALAREVKEETGLEVVNAIHDHFDEDYENNKHGEMTHYVFLTFLVEVGDLSALPNDDLVKLEWVEKERLKELELTRPSIKYLKKIGWIK